LLPRVPVFMPCGDRRGSGNALPAIYSRRQAGDSAEALQLTGSFRDARVLDRDHQVETVLRVSVPGPPRPRHGEGACSASSTRTERSCLPAEEEGARLGSDHEGPQLDIAGILDAIPAANARSGQPDEALMRS
jgi:hypothetical protein